MFIKALFVLFMSGGLLFAQNGTVHISDSSGNQASGTISNGSVYFHDSNGNSAYGTIRNGTVFLNSNGGELTFGTIKDGNVFLTDQGGNTTGTIRNGNIFLQNSDGSVTTGSYDSGANVFTSTTPSQQQQQQEQQRKIQQQNSQQQQDQEQQKKIQQQNYEAGAAFGRVIGSDIAAAIERHRINSFCKANPTSIAHLQNGVDIPCPNSPLDDSATRQVNNYCADNPGLWIEIGNQRVNCYTPPSSPNQKWAAWEMKEWQWNYRHQRNKAVVANALSGDQLRIDWELWRAKYRSLSSSGTTYKDLNDKKERCN